jgi:hypothetical protein
MVSKTQHKNLFRDTPEGSKNKSKSVASGNHQNIYLQISSKKTSAIVTECYLCRPITLLKKL